MTKTKSIRQIWAQLERMMNLCEDLNEVGTINRLNKVGDICKRYTHNIKDYLTGAKGMTTGEELLDIPVSSEIYTKQ